VWAAATTLRCSLSAVAKSSCEGHDRVALLGGEGYRPCAKESVMSSQHRRSSARSVLLHERARVMRAQPTLSEARLWAQLLGRKLGVAFRRQVVLGEYIVDFLAPTCRLVVEV
jgi:hypothetical protein